MSGRRCAAKAIEAPLPSLRATFPRTATACGARWGKGRVRRRRQEQASFPHRGKMPGEARENVFALPARGSGPLARTAAFQITALSSKLSLYSHEIGGNGKVKQPVSI